MWVKRTKIAGFHIDCDNYIKAITLRQFTSIPTTFVCSSSMRRYILVGPTDGIANFDLKDLGGMMNWSKALIALQLLSRPQVGKCLITLLKDDH